MPEGKSVSLVKLWVHSLVELTHELARVLEVRDASRA